ncbi:amino acid permease-domain-containing protein [Phascolomyces articulosus]|uniref:Amino acid permease-domain-containing protein n=1 Tax=Phascolomyces articulosus TaxID=60185 RepID=A0AAD5PE83_9FUNG|nr:amino acid permease-domain-containing protein [Phascolomyces articulosus]
MVSVDEDREFLISDNEADEHVVQVGNMEPLAVGDQRLERKIGWLSGAMVNISYIIGAGIFVGPSLTLGLLGSGGMNIIAWTIGALIAMAGSWTFAELETEISFGIYVYNVELDESFNVLTVVKISVLGLVIFVGILTLIGAISNDIDVKTALSFQGTSDTIAPYASALYYVMNSYSGWHNLNFILDEVKDPIKNLPKASAVALGTTAVLYVMTNVSYLAVLGTAAMKDSKYIVAASFFTKSLGENFATKVLPVLIALGAFGCGASINFSAGRIIMETGRSGLLPYGRTLGHVNPKVKSPVNAYLLQYFLTIIFTVALPPGAVYQFIIAFQAYPVYVFYTLIALSVIILRKREPYNKRPIVAPLVLPYVTAIASMFVYAILWYYQIVIRDTPGKSYNEDIRRQGQAALEREVFGGGYTRVSTEENTTS